MVKALHKLFLLFCFCCVTTLVNAQVLNVNLETFTDVPVTHTFLSRNQPATSFFPQNGDFELTATGVPFQYELTYTPDPGFEGSDEIRLLYFPIELPNGFAVMRFNITVVPLILNAVHDVSTTMVNTAVSIPVLNNDYSSTGVLNLISAPAVNGGTTQVVGNNILFTPSPGFTGLTDFNYVVCAWADGYDYCTTGTVSVNVLQNGGIAALDTVQVFSKRFSVGNSGAMILVPSNYDLVAPPVNGTYDTSGDIPYYRPLPGHTGVEYIDYSNGADVITYRIETLDLVTNDFSQPDQAYTRVDGEVTINVIQNDLYGAFTGCISYDPPAFGSLEVASGTGQVIYTPPAGWTGVDRFFYTAFPPGCAPGTAETEMVTVVISNFEPAAADFTLTTATGAALPFTYGGPNGGISWQVIQPPTLGTVVTDNETGQLTYLPSPTTAGIDYLIVQYCLEDGEGGCTITENVTVTINVIAADDNIANCNTGDDCVWPGDTNHDGIVDVADLLPIGYHMGNTGTPRTSAEPDAWAPQYAEDWEEEDNGINRKHVDADGDQFITSADTQVVRQNLGMVSRIFPDVIPPANYDIILEGDIFAEPGDIAEISVLLGSSYIGVEDVAGFIFPFNYDVTFIDASSLLLDFDEGSWLSYDSPVLSMVTNDTINGQLTAAHVRTSGLATSGYGRVASLYIGVEDVAGFRPAVGDPTIVTTTIGGGEGESMTGTGHRNGVRVRPLDLNIVFRAEPLQPIDQDIDAYLEEKLLTFPNPTSGQLTVHLNGQREFTALTMTDFTGRTIERYNGPATNHRTLDLTAYPNGIYSLQITIAEGVINRKIEVFR